MGLSTQQMFCFSPDILATANKMPILTISTASDQCQNSDSWKNRPSSTIPTYNSYPSASKIHTHTTICQHSPYRTQEHESTLK